MPYDPHRHHRRSIRLPGFDYRSLGAYYVTVCARERGAIFGEIVDGEVQLNPSGQIVADTWLSLATRYPYLSLDAWVVMPDHLHGIIDIGKPPAESAYPDVPVPAPEGASRRAPTICSPEGASRRAPTIAVSPISASEGASRRAPTIADPTKVKPLGQIIAAFKTVSTRAINDLQNTPGMPMWQRDFWEHVIRDPRDLNRIRAYIQDNPRRWAARRI